MYAWMRTRQYFDALGTHFTMVIREITGAMPVYTCLNVIGMVYNLYLIKIT
jgi:hypothetical protein